MHADGLRQYEFNPDQARALLAEAGFSNGFEVALLVPTGRSEREKVASLIQENLAGLGIRIELRFMEPRELFARGRETPLFGRQFDMALVGWVAGVEPPAELFLCEEVSGRVNAFGGPNISGYCSEAFDTRALVAMSTSAPNQRRAQWSRAQRVFAEEVPAIPLFQHVKLAATRPGVAGFTLDPSQPSEMWNVENFARENG
jgi:ABC-type transport system substrate-binding protein